MSTIRYFIPEDGDTESNPNVFLAPKPSRPGYPPTLEQVKSAFPLPGRYHFRFKTTLVPGVDKGPVVWMDCADDGQPVGVYKNSIIAKITRLSFEDDDEDEQAFRAAETAAYRSENNVPYTRTTTPQTSSTPSATPRVSPPPPKVAPTPVKEDASFFNVFDDRSTSFPASAHSSAGDLLDGLGDSPPAADPLLSMSHSGTDDHDFFGGATTSAPSAFPSAHDELLNMSAPAPVPVQQPHQQQYPPQQRTYSSNVQQVNGSFANMNVGGPMPQGVNQRNGSANMQQTPQQPMRQPSSAPSSGNLRPKGASVFDSFQAQQSPFADLGRLL